MKAVVDRIVQYANRYQLTNVETGEVLGTFDFEEVTGTVQQVGTEIDKELFDSISADLAARVKLSGGELAETIVTFPDMSGTAENVASGDTSATLWGKVKNWFSRLKALAFKNKVAAGDFEAGAIKNADVAADAAIAQSKVNGLMTDYVASISASGRTVTYKNKSGVNMGSITTQDTTYGLASQSSNGLMSSTDKTKLDGIESGAQKNTVLGVKGGSESAYRTGNVNITKANIGLGNVDNTSDEDKPVSAATQKALNGKANTSGTYPNLTVGKAKGAQYLSKQININQSNTGWVQIATLKRSTLPSGGNYSCIMLVSGIYNVQGQSDAAESGKIEIDVRGSGSAIQYYGLSVLGGNINPNEWCIVADSNGVNVYLNLPAAFQRYLLTVESEGWQTALSVDYIELLNTYYGTAAPSGAVYAVVRNNASGDENGNGLMSHATRNELLNGTQSYDFNDYIEWGHYELQGTSGTPLVNAPTSTSNPSAADANWYLDVYRRDSFYVTQIAYSARSDGAIAIRVLSNNSWGSWRVVIDSGTVPNATNATNDGEGNNIKETYAKKNDVGTVVKTTTEWQAQNPVLSAGQFGYDTTNKITKVGDGSTLWSALPFLVTTDLNFANASWKKIAILAENGDARNIFSVGDEKTINLTSGLAVTLVILGFNHDNLTSGGKAGITIGTKELLSTSYYNAMNSSNTNAGGWNSSRMRSSVMTTILSQLPPDLQEVIKSVDKKTTSGGGATSIVTSSDKLFLLSQVEIDGTVENGYAGEGNQYEYWQTIKNGALASDRVKYLANGTGGAGIWWLRSPIVDNSVAFRSITQSGSYSNLLASNTCAISFAFCV